MFKGSFSAKIPFSSFLTLSLLLLPLLWINVGDSHDWGGDFAQYLQEAKNLVEGRSLTESGYVYNPAYPMLGPPAYPAGYPLLLAPVYVGFGNDMLAFIRYQSFLLLLLGIAMFVFFRLRFSPLSSVLLVLVVMYNPWTLNFKRELMSDIPFSLFLLLAVICFEKGKGAWAGLAAGFAIMIRSSGWAWVGAMLPLLVIAGFIYVRKRDQPIDKRFWLGSLILAVALPVLANTLIFRLPSGFDLYSKNIFGGGFPLFENLAYYVDVVQWFFQAPAKEEKFLPLTIKTVMFTLIVVGGINRWLQRPRMVDWLLVSYVLVLLLYPYRAGGFRFLFPVLPILMVYAVEGFQAITWRRQLPRRWRPLVLAALLLIPYARGIHQVCRRQGRVLAGPQQQGSQEAFQAVKQQVPAGAVVVFAKPRVLAYYTGTKSTALGREQSVEEAQAWLQESQSAYALQHIGLKDPALERLLAEKEGLFEEIWTNATFSLYQKRDASIQLNP